MAGGRGHPARFGAMQHGKGRKEPGKGSLEDGSVPRMSVREKLMSEYIPNFQKKTETMMLLDEVFCGIYRAFSFTLNAHREASAESLHDISKGE